MAAEERDVTNVREIAFEVLLQFDKGIAGNTLINDVLTKYSYLDKQDRSFLTRLIEGVIERSITIEYVLSLYSKTSVNKLKPPVRVLLKLGVYQIMYMDVVPDSAAVNEVVKIAKKRGLHNLSGFINGVLRNISRQKDNINWPDENKDLPMALSVKYSCPLWIVKELLADYTKERCESVLSASISVRPITGRVNITKASRDEIIANNCEIVDKNELLEYAIGLHNVDKIADINDFREGKFTIQDISSMLVCHVAGINSDDTIIDVCASPGGKSMHAADLANNGQVIACDVSDNKIERIEENINRCGFTNISTYVRDASVLESDFVDKADVVIADVPCSGLGVMGRKNDIKYNLKPDELPGLIKLQRDILRNVSNYVKKGGILMFSTCTVRKQENDDNFTFIKDELGLEPVGFYDELPQALKDDTAKDGYLQLYSKDGLTDGFFIAKFRKV